MFSPQNRFIMFRPRLALRLYPYFLFSHTRILSLRTTRRPLSTESDTDTYTTLYGVIPIEKLDIKFSKSRGPGGQNVNKVNTRVQLRFRVNEADWLPEIVRNAIFEKYKNKFTNDGELLLESQRFTTQYSNQRDAITKLQSIIETVYKEPGVPSQEKLGKIAKFKEISKENNKLMKLHRKRNKRDHFDL